MPPHRVAQHPEVRDRATGQAQRIGRGRGGGEERSLELSEPLIGLGIGGQQDLDRLAQCAIGGAERRKTAGRLGSSSATSSSKVAWISSQRRESIRESVKRFALELEREPGARRAQLSLRCCGRDAKRRRTLFQRQAPEIALWSSWLCRGLTASSRRSASCSCVTLSRFSSEIQSISSSSTGALPPPRFVAARHGHGRPGGSA